MRVLAISIATPVVAQYDTLPEVGKSIFCGMRELLLCRTCYTEAVAVCEEWLGSSSYEVV